MIITIFTLFWRLARIYVKMIDLALKYSGHVLKSKNLLAMLTKSDRFIVDSNFQTLKPKYNVTPRDIEKRIIDELSKGKSVE